MAKQKEVSLDFIPLQSNKFEVKCILIDRPFKCTECEWAFKRRCELDVHMMRHKRIYPFVCDLCGKGTCTSTELRAHKRIHTGEKPYGCKQCTLSKNKMYIRPINCLHCYWVHLVVFEKDFFFSRPFKI